MANKLVDSTKLDASLAYTADRIRAKTGESADILFDLSNEKGFGDAIDAIETGGGTEMAEGTVVLSSASQYVSVSIPFKPDHAMIYAHNADIGTDNTWKMIASILYDWDTNGMRIMRYGASNVNVAAFAASAFTYSNGRFRFTSNDNYKFVAGVTYYWFAWGGESE